jgi:hypothetical protein
MSRLFEGDEGGGEHQLSTHDHSVEAHLEPELHVQHESAVELQMGDNTTRLEQDVSLDYATHVSLGQTMHDGIASDSP